MNPEEFHRRLEETLSAETHPVLTQNELLAIKELRRKIALGQKTKEEIPGLIFEWTKTGVVTKRQHILLCKYHYQS